MLDEAGDHAPKIMRLYNSRGDEAMWIIRQSERRALFIKHGEPAADAMLKHPHLAESVLQRYGDSGASALNRLSRGGAQKLGMADDSGLFTATPRSRELLHVIRAYGDEAMDFIWENKGALTVAAMLTKFLSDPEAFIKGFKSLVIDPVVTPAVESANWTLIFAGVLFFLFLPSITRMVRRADPS